MNEYVPPLRDIAFVMEHVADLDEIVRSEAFGHVDVPTIHAVLEEVGRFMADVIAPTNRDGDTIGSRWQPDGSVVTPDSFKPAYSKWVGSGFGAMPFDPDHGGGGFPWIVGHCRAGDVDLRQHGVVVVPAVDARRDRSAHTPRLAKRRRRTTCRGC